MTDKIIFKTGEATIFSKSGQPTDAMPEYEGMKLAIRRAINDEPSIDELIANRHKIHHEMYDPETGGSIW